MKKNWSLGVTEAQAEHDVKKSFLSDCHVKNNGGFNKFKHLPPPKMRGGYSMPPPQILQYQIVIIGNGCAVIVVTDITGLAWEFAVSVCPICT